VEKWTSWDYYKLRGRSYLRNKQYAKAEKDFTEALKIAPDDGKSYFSRADVRERMGKYKEAIQDLTLTIKWDPNNGRAFSMRAKIYEHLGETARAASDRKAAVKLGEKQWGI
jgi:Tfp pilus assembly protein PilF